jgi:hypothetical protein
LTTISFCSIINAMIKVKVEKNKETNKWRYFDVEKNLYSSEEWDTRKKAWAMSTQYYDLIYKNK